MLKFTVLFSSNSKLTQPYKIMILSEDEITAQNRNPRWRPSAILDFRKSDFWELEPLGLPIFHLRTNFSAKMLINAEIMAAVRHLGFSKIRLLNIGTPWTADFPSRYKIWWQNVDRYRNYSPTSKSKMAAVRHLGFSKIWFLRTGTPWVAISPYKFWSAPPCQIWPWSVQGWGFKAPKTEKNSNFPNIIAPKGRVPCTMFTKFTGYMLVLSLYYCWIWLLYCDKWQNY